MPHPRRPVRRAFTLVELIATMAILAALGSVISVIVSTSVNGYTRASTNAQLHSELSIALDRIDQMLRFIPPSAAGDPDISSVTATSITWSTNWALTLSGTQLLLSEAGGPSSILLKDVSAFSVTAYDQSNTALAASLSGGACDSIRRIRVSITLTRSGVSETLRTKVFIRSMMSGVSP